MSSILENQPHFFHTWRRSRPARSAVEVSVFQYPYTGTTEVLWGKRDGATTLCSQEESASERLSHSLKGGVPLPLPWPSFIGFPGPLHQRRSSFTQQRFVLGGYLCRHRKGCGWIHQRRTFAMQREKWSKGLGSRLVGSSPDFKKIKIFSKHLLASGWGSFLARASLIAV